MRFGCTCSQSRSENAIRILGEAEAYEELRDKQQIVVTCEFCNSQYKFDRIDVTRIFTEGNKPQSSGEVH